MTADSTLLKAGKSKSVKKVPESRALVRRETLRDLGRGPKTHAPRPTVEEDLDDLDIDDRGNSGRPVYRTDYVDRANYGSSGPVRVDSTSINEIARAVVTSQRFSSDATRDLAAGIAASLQFHPQTIRDLAKAVALQLQLLPDTIASLAEAIYGRLEKNMAALVEVNAKQADGKVECSVCEDSGHRHIHPFDDMTTKDICNYTGWKPSAIYGRTKNGLMPPPVSAVKPHTYDPHCIALLKDHGLVFPQSRYDRDVHLALLPKVEAELAKKKAAFRKKQSAMMTRENKRRAAALANPDPSPMSPRAKTSRAKSTHTRTPKKKKR